MTSKTLSQSRLKELLDYDADTGIFIWKKRPLSDFKTARDRNIWNTRYSGKEAGSEDANGYREIGIFGERYRSHRLAILHSCGSFPEKETDHINGIRDDNRISNLRCVTRRENNMNQKLRKGNSSGVAGVTWQKNKWCARIGIGGRKIHLGQFDSYFDAVCCRKAVESHEAVGYHANHGRQA